MAYATTDSKLTTLDADNFFETTLKTLVTDGTDTNIYLNALPDPAEGFLTIEPTNSSTREIIFYNAKGADYVTCPSASAGRGVGGTTAQGHAVSSVVRMAPVAEIWRVLRDRHSALALGWEPADTAHTCGSDNVITVPSDATTKYAIGGKLKIVVSGTTYYGYVIAVAATTVTGIFGTAAGAAYTLSSGATITSMWYSNAASPVGFPHAFATAIGFVRFEGGTMIQYGNITITCASGSDNAAGTINFPTGLNFADTNYTFTVSGARSTSFASVNETAFTCHSTHTAAQAVITLFTRAGTWAANRSPVVYWRAEGKI